MFDNCQGRERIGPGTEDRPRRLSDTCETGALEHLYSRCLVMEGDLELLALIDRGRAGFGLARETWSEAPQSAGGTLYM